MSTQHSLRSLMMTLTFPKTVRSYQEICNSFSSDCEKHLGLMYDFSDAASMEIAQTGLTIILPYSALPKAMTLETIQILLKLGGSVSITQEALPFNPRTISPDM